MQVLKTTSKTLSALIGQTLTKIAVRVDSITFTLADGRELLMAHAQDKNELVDMIHFMGDMQSLIGSPITFAQKMTGDMLCKSPEIGQWTVFEFGTASAWVGVRWVGFSSENASLEVTLFGA